MAKRRYRKPKYAVVYETAGDPVIRVVAQPIFSSVKEAYAACKRLNAERPSHNGCYVVIDL
jgi:hypothetical protein